MYMYIDHKTIISMYQHLFVLKIAQSWGMPWGQLIYFSPKN